MKLYFTPGSPYARMSRIVVIEKKLGRRVQLVVAKTRHVDSPYYKLNPSGRVPYLARDDGVGIEGSTVICAYLDQIDGEPTLATPQGADAWEARRLEASAQSTLEGLAVWARELCRPESERSPTAIAHEMARAVRMLDFWEQSAEHPLLVGPLNMLQIVLACALGLEARTFGTHWHAAHPNLGRWYSAVSRRPSLIATRPPARAA
ncbi:MAG: glutathione S-transferase family protein [Rhodanobacteraceae bacterium]